MSTKNLIEFTLGGEKERVPAAPLEKAEDRFDGQNDVNLKRAEEAVVMVNGNGI